MQFGPDDLTPQGPQSSVCPILCHQLPVSPPLCLCVTPPSTSPPTTSDSYPPCQLSLMARITPLAALLVASSLFAQAPAVEVRQLGGGAAALPAC